MQDLVTLLKFKYQIILQGPPGTGKTYTAKELAKNILGADWEDKPGKRWDIVQLHPSYTYEDFVRGLVAEVQDGKIA